MLKIEYRDPNELIPYESNPRYNDNAVDAVAASIAEFGFNVPIVIDAGGVIVAGDTRRKAALQLGLTEVPCIRAEHMTSEQVKAFRLADNKTAELADWNEELLKKELQGILNLDMKQFGFSLDDENDAGDEETTYTKTVNIPQYEITGSCPDITDLVDPDFANELIDEIDHSDIGDDEKEFLKMAARRHYVFDYRNIAEYYAHTTPEMQRLMERSALVIIDIDDAIANGYARLSDEIMDMLGSE